MPGHSARSLRGRSGSTSCGAILTLSGMPRIRRQIALSVARRRRRSLATSQILNCGVNSEKFLSTAVALTGQLTPGELNGGSPYGATTMASLEATI
jgi:hypothetical protein